VALPLERFEVSTMYDVKSPKAEEFISHQEILDTLAYAEENKENRELLDAILAKAATFKGLNHREAAVLLECPLPEYKEKLFALAKEIKKAIYGDRIVLFAPLYLSNYCINGCVYCPYHSKNRDIKRKKLTQDQIREEVIALEAMGHKRIVIESGEDPLNNPLEYILESIKTIYSIKNKNGEIRRVNVNIAACSVEDYKKLHEAGIGTYTLFQETYNKENYEALHPTGPKSDYAYHTEAMDRAMQGGIDDVDAPFMEQIKHQADIAMTEADVIVFVVSGKEGVTDADEYVARILYKTNKPVILAVNKVDNPEMRADIYDFYSLGLGDPYPVSSVHGIGTGDVLDAIVENLPTEVEEENPDIIRFSLIGRPNVGKSSLINAILGEDRVIASPIAGTTRDAIDTNFVDSEGQEYTMIDTAGMRKSGKVYENTEKYSVMRSMRAIDRSDIVLMVINAEEGIREYDKRIAGFAHEAGKGIIIVVNKWDTIKKDNHTVANWEADIRDQFQFLSYAPIIFVSAETKQRLNKLPEMIKRISESQNRRISSAVLNDVIMDAIAINPTPTDKGKRLKIFYGTQVSVKPPTFVIFVNEEELMHFSYMRFLENQIRQAFGFEGTPIHLIARKRK